MIPIDTIHTFRLVSRSGRAGATLGSVDLEQQDERRTIGEVVADMAAIAHSVMSDSDRNVLVRHGLEAAFAVCERIPGTIASGAVLLEDGRTAMVVRHIRGDDAVDRIGTRIREGPA